MPRFVWTATDKFGNSVVREIPADTAEQAKAHLTSEGCTDVKLQENKVMAELPMKSNAEMRFKRRNKPPRSFFGVLRECVVLGGPVCIVIILLAAVETYHGKIVSAVICGLGLVIWLAYLFCIQLPSIFLKKLHKALDWHRWDEALQLVNKLRWFNRFHFIKIPQVPETTLTRYRANALAGMGNLSQALEEYAPCENQPGCPRRAP